MTQEGLKTLIRKVQNECSLEEPEKVTYYIDDDDKVVLKLYFDSLKLPKSLRGEDKEHYDWHSSVANTFTNNEEYLYDDDFTILEYNEEKGYVKVLPDDQSFKRIDNYKDVAADSIKEVETNSFEKQEESVKIAGKLLNEKVARSYGYLLYEEESEPKPNVEKDFIDNVKAEATEEKEEVKQRRTMFFAMTCTYPSYAAVQLSEVVSAIQNYAKTAKLEEYELDAPKLIISPNQDSILGLNSEDFAKAIVDAPDGAILSTPQRKELATMVSQFAAPGSRICYLDDACKTLLQAQMPAGILIPYNQNNVDTKEKTLPEPTEVYSAASKYAQAEAAVKDEMDKIIMPMMQQFFKRVESGEFAKVFAKAGDKAEKDKKKEGDDKNKDNKGKKKDEESEKVGESSLMYRLYKQLLEEENENENETSNNDNPPAGENENPKEGENENKDDEENSKNKEDDKDEKEKDKKVSKFVEIIVQLLEKYKMTDDFEDAAIVSYMVIEDWLLTAKNIADLGKYKAHLDVMIQNAKEHRNVILQEVSTRLKRMGTSYAKMGKEKLKKFLDNSVQGVGEEFRSDTSQNNKVNVGTKKKDQDVGKKGDPTASDLYLKYYLALPDSDNAISPDTETVGEVRMKVMNLIHFDVDGTGSTNEGQPKDDKKKDDGGKK